MPVNNNWRVEAGNFHYKAQDFTNSCFPACLQMALENFGLIHGIQMGHPGRPIEEAFSTFFYQKYQGNMDTQPPTLDIVDDFMLNSWFQGRNNIHVEILRELTAFNVDMIQDSILANENIAIIGTMRDQMGHATMIIKKQGQLFGVNPANLLQDFFAQIGDIGDIHFLGEQHPLPGQENRRVLDYLPLGFVMSYCYIVTLH